MAEDSESRKPAAGQVTSGGLSAPNTAPGNLTYRVSPNTQGEDSASIRPMLRPIGCVRIDDSRFDFDSSFILPDATQEFALLANRRAVDAKTPLSVFGHADPVNEDDYNKQLSARRAQALYAVLVRDVELWNQLFEQPFRGDGWGYNHLCLMLNEIGFPTPVVTSANTASRNAVRDFQNGNSIVPASGDVDKRTRTLLFASYMDAICLDSRGVTFQYKKSDFLSKSDEGTPSGVPDFQGCGEFNPVFVFSKQLDKDLSDPKRKTERNSANSSNRRVVVYVFPEDVAFPLDKWPCPAKGTDGCRKQFWKDGEQRRKPQELSRQYLHTHNTFACKFYDRIARGSPCEAVRQRLTIFLQDDAGKLMKNAPFRLTLDAETREGNANSAGEVVLTNVYLSNKGVLEWGEPTDITPKDGEKFFRFRRAVFFDLDRDDAEVSDRQLHNLGIDQGDRDQKFALFRLQQRSNNDDDAALAQEIATVNRQGTERPDAEA